ncbi:hypothetical protein B0H13DRAFT_1891994 [Mycena leptocephala]|nr:hypothetical protein B0H13DRAFT_1891994 [Mycena leptocephala]
MSGRMNRARDMNGEYDHGTLLIVSYSDDGEPSENEEASARMPVPIRGLNEHKICPASHPFRETSEMDDVGRDSSGAPVPVRFCCGCGCRSCEWWWGGMLAKAGVDIDWADSNLGGDSVDSVAFIWAE